MKCAVMSYEVGVDRILYCLFDCSVTVKNMNAIFHTLHCRNRYDTISAVRFTNVQRLLIMSNKVSLTEAATFLGVSKATLRNWDNGNKLHAIRNPLNGYRTYDMDELIRLKQDIGESEPQPSSEKTTGMDNKSIKRTIGKVASIIRDGCANSNIVTRFDEISKLLFVKLVSERNGANVFEPGIFETDEEYKKRIQLEYSEAIQRAKIHVPEQFQEIKLPNAVVWKCGIELGKFNITSASCDVKGLAYEDTIKGTFDKSDNQQFFTPYQVVNFMVDMMDGCLTGTICDPACGTGGFLTCVTQSEPDARISGFEIDERLAWVANMNLFIHGCRHFKVLTLGDGGSLGKCAKTHFGTVNAILTNPPFGSDYTERSILDLFKLGSGHPSRRRGILFIEQSWNLLKENGVLAIVIDNGVLNSTSTVDVRRFILDHFQIRAIIDMPETAFLPYANVSTSILVLKKVTSPVEQTSVFYAKSNRIGRKPNGDDDIIYSENGEPSLNSDLPSILEQWRRYRCGEVLSQNSGCYVANVAQNIGEDPSLRLDYAYHHPFREQSRNILKKSPYPLMTLAEICQERNVSYIPAANMEASTIQFTGLANIESYTGKVAQISTPTASIKSAVKRYEADDIIFSKMRPALRKTAVIPFVNGGYVSSECAVFSVRKANDGELIIDPELLSAILRSDLVFGQIMSRVTGIGRPRISTKDLRNIKIPIPPRDVQKKARLSMSLSQSSVMQLREKASMLLDEATNLERTALNNVAKIVSGK